MYGMQASHNWLADSLLTHVAFIDETNVMYLLRKKFEEVWDSLDMGSQDVVLSWKVFVSGWIWGLA